MPLPGGQRGMYLPMTRILSRMRPVLPCYRDNIRSLAKSLPENAHWQISPKCVWKRCQQTAAQIEKAMIEFELGRPVAVQKPDP